MKKSEGSPRALHRPSSHPAVNACLHTAPEQQGLEEPLKVLLGEPVSKEHHSLYLLNSLTQGPLQGGRELESQVCYIRHLHFILDIK